MTSQSDTASVRQVPVPRPGDAFRYLDGITITHDGRDLATVSVHFPAKLLTSQAGWVVDSNLQGWK